MSRLAFWSCIAVVLTSSYLYGNPAFRIEGRVFPLQMLDILPSIDGIVKSVNFKAGDMVSKGDVLFQLDDFQQRKMVETCRAEFNTAQSESDKAERLYRRLSGSDSRGTTKVEIEEVKCACEVTLSNRDRAKAQLELAEDELSKMCIRAPFDGKIGLCAVAEGSVVTVFREPLSRLVQMDPVRVLFNYPISKRNPLVGAKVALIFADGEKYGHMGIVDFENHEASDDGASVMIGATVPNPDGVLIPGMKIAVEIDSVNR